MAEPLIEPRGDIADQGCVSLQRPADADALLGQPAGVALAAGAPVDVLALD